MSNSLQSSPWNSLSQNTGVGSLSLLQGIFPTQASHIEGRFFTREAIREAQESWCGYPIPSPADLPNPGNKPGSPALQVDSLPTELSKKPLRNVHQRPIRTKEQTEMSNTLVGINIRITEGEEQINDLEDRMVEITATEQDIKKAGKEMKTA